MRYLKALEANDIKPGEKMKIVLENNEILLANLEGTFYAVDNTCPHMGGALSDGKLEGSNIICPRHGSVFDLKSGQVVKNGKILFITAKVHNIKSYPVKLDGTDVMIGLE